MTTYQAYWSDRAIVGRVVFAEGSLNDCRKAITARIREERWHGSRFAALWPDKPVSKLTAGDSVVVTIGKQGYHLWARYSICVAR